MQKIKGELSGLITELLSMVIYIVFLYLVTLAIVR